ncbi:Hint domain-containing protein [Erwinia sp. ErVv1]|uniref:Hint domain-containing protein n=1 Tax=Erwinia sp. ErVv1 TaxID=1603299 RepID=UPI000832F526|nr:Hint domain-containing protein [Erwinia sp. ErVv1]
MNAQSYTSDEKSIVKTVIRKYGNKGGFIIDPGDPLLVSFYDIQQKLAGLDSGNYPHFIQRWQNTKQCKHSTGLVSQAATRSAEAVYSIVRLDSTDGKYYRTDAIGSLPVSATNVTQTLGLFDNDASNTGTVKHTQNYINTADCIISANGVYPDSAKENGNPVTAIYTFSQTIANKTIYGAEIITTQSYPKEIHNQSPTTIHNPNEIKICLTRDEADCDYSQPYAGGGIVSVPVKGTITYGGNIDVSGGRPVNGMSSIYLIRARAGGDPIFPSAGFDFFDPKNSSAVADKISWDLSWLNFNRVDFDSGERVYYIFKLILSVSGKSVAAFITNAPKNILPEQKFLNTLNIKPMKIVYGCLHENTKIMMHDGSEKLISAIEMGESVLTANDSALMVENITTGQEQHCIKISVKDEDNNKHSVIASPGHPFITASGVVTCRELKLSDQLFTPQGKCEITDIQPQTDELTVYNLQLSAEKVDENILYANHILVGDIQMQRFYEDEYYERPVNILSKLPREWHEDYLNHLKSTGE